MKVQEKVNILFEFKAFNWIKISKVLLILKGNKRGFVKLAVLFCADYFK